MKKQKKRGKLSYKLNGVLGKQWKLLGQRRQKKILISILLIYSFSDLLGFSCELVIFFIPKIKVEKNKATKTGSEKGWERQQTKIQNTNQEVIVNS